MFHPGIPEAYRNQILYGDARSLSMHIPDESVDLVFTDPVYERVEDYLWVANEAARVLKPNSACLLWQGQQWIEKTMLALAASDLRYRWILGWYASNNMQMVGKVGRKIAPLLWYEKGHSNPKRVCREVVDVPIPSNQPAFHKWSKNPVAVRHYLYRFANPGDTVWDPFSGGGTTALVCRELGLNFIGSECDPETATLARERVRLTPEPLLIVESEPPQMELTLAYSPAPVNLSLPSG